MTPQPAFIASVTQVLRPLVRLLIGRGFTFPQLAELLKGVYLEVAESDFPLKNKAQTDSRLHLLTGVHRKDVRRLRGQPQARPEAPPAVTLGAQAVARWSSDPAYLDANGQPRPLSRRAEAGNTTFETLIESISKDIRARAVLDEWLRLGVVEIDNEDQVRLITAAFIPQRGDEEKLYYFAHNLHDHLAAGICNLEGTAPACMERSVHYSALSPDAIAEIQALAEKRGMAALQAVNARCLELKTVPAANTRRMTFGIYFYDTPDEESSQHESR